MRSARATAGAAAAAALAAWSLGACGSTTDQSATTTGPASTTVKSSSKLPDAVTRTLARLQAGEKPGTNGTFTDSGVPVRDDGKVQLEFHTSAPVTDAQKADLTALGADIVAAGPAVGLVDAWVPFDKVGAAAGLPWVASVTVPSPTRGP